MDDKIKQKIDDFFDSPSNVLDIQYVFSFYPFPPSPTHQ